MADGPVYPNIRVLLRGRTDNPSPFRMLAITVAAMQHNGAKPKDVVKVRSLTVGDRDELLTELERWVEVV